MTSKQMLLSALILSATTNNALGMKPVQFTMNIDDTDIISNLDKATFLAINTTSDEEPYTYTLMGNLYDLQSNKEEIKKLLKNPHLISCVYCPGSKGLILDAKDDIDCHKWLAGALLTENRYLIATNRKLQNSNMVLQQEINILKNSSSK